MNLNRCSIACLFVILTFWLPLPAFVSADGLAPGEQRKFILPEPRVEKYSLTNGLTVILHEDHKTPLVAVNVVYKVGSKDDPPGRGGLAHLFEHLMCEGSQHSDEAFANAVNEFQCDVNAKTGRDRTFYYETVTANALERVLWLEADRMGFFLPALTREKLDAVRNVVKNERRSRFENAPFGAAEGVILGELYPAGHPYQHLMIGSMADLSASQLADASAFFSRYYAPSNACLCLAGDFETAQAKRWIEKYFGPLHRGVEIAPSKPNVPSLARARNITLTDRVNHARAQLVWPTVPAGHPDEAALDVLASVLGGLSNENRLYRRLVHDQHLAVVAETTHPTFLLSGEFWVNLIAQPGRSLAELVRLTDAEIQRLKNEGPTSVEVRRAQMDRERSTIKELESVAGKAEVLCRDVAGTGDPRWSLTTLEKVFAVTSADVQRVARQYLGPCRIEVDVVPGALAVQTPDMEAAPGEKVAPVNPPVPPIGDVFDDSIPPVLGPTPRFTAPPFQRQKLSNGLKLRIVERHGVPLVTLALIVKSGETSTPSGKEGLCKITASLIDEGTKSRTALEIAGEMADIGGTLSVDGFLEATNIEMTALTRHLERALDLYADVVMNPSFTEKAVERIKLEREAELDGGRTIDTIISDRVFDRLIYPHGHVYARPYLGTLRSTRSITRDDAVDFYRKSFVPGNAELVIVGDVQTERIVAALEARLGAWRPGPLPSLPRVPDQVPPANQPLYLIDLPGATQSVITVGRASLSAKSPDREALSALNTNLGARINWIIRDEKGYSYGINARFPFRIGPAPCVWTGSVQTSATKDALVVLMEEMTGITGPKAITEEELTQMAARIPIGLGQFETDSGITDQIWYLVTYNLGDDYYDKKFDDFNFVSKADVDRVAKEYLKPELMTILVVGDRSKVEGPLKSLPFVKSIHILDTEGNPLPESAAVKSAVK